MSFLNMLNPISEWDIGILDWIAEHLKCGFLDWFMSVVTHLGDGGYFCILLALVLICIPKTRKYGLYVAGAILVGTLLCNVTLKPLIARIRPWVYLESFHAEHVIPTYLIKRPTDFSFPSGHTVIMVETATALMFWKKRIGIPAVAVALIVAFSRLYLYVHYVTDVLGGIVLGVVAAILGKLLIDGIIKLIHRTREKRNTEAPEGQT